MRDARGAGSVRHEPPLYSCERCFATRRRGPWAIAMAITTKIAAAAYRVRPPPWPRGDLGPSGTSNTGITQDRVTTRVLPGNIRPWFPVPGIWPAIRPSAAVHSGMALLAWRRALSGMIRFIPPVVPDPDPATTAQRSAVALLRLGRRVLCVRWTITRERDGRVACATLTYDLRLETRRTLANRPPAWHQ